MRQFRKVGRHWQYKVGDGEWRDDYLEPDINILQPDWDGKGFYWPDLELKDTGKKGKGVFASRDLPKGAEIPILGKIQEEGDYSQTHSWQRYDRSRPVNHRPEFIDGHPKIDPHKGVGSFGLSISMMNCVFRQSNYVQLTRDVKKGQELTIFYGNSREMLKIRKDRGYSISHDSDTMTMPKEAGTPAQRVKNWQHWMGLIQHREKDKSDDITKDKVEMPRRTGSRNTYHCKYLNTKKCDTTPGQPPTLYINPDVGVTELHCMDCMKRELTMKGAKSVAPGEWAKILGEASSSSSSEPKKKPKKKKEPIQLVRSDSDSSMGSLRLSLSPFEESPPWPLDETPPALRATRDDSPINLHMPRNIAMSNIEEFSYTDLPRKPRKSVADVLDKFYRDHNIKL